MEKRKKNMREIECHYRNVCYNAMIDLFSINSVI